MHLSTSTRVSRKFFPFLYCGRTTRPKILIFGGVVPSSFIWICAKAQPYRPTLAAGADAGVYACHAEKIVKSEDKFFRIFSYRWFWRSIMWQTALWVSKTRSRPTTRKKLFHFHCIFVTLGDISWDAANSSSRIPYASLLSCLMDCQHLMICHHKKIYSI